MSRQSKTLWPVPGPPFTVRTYSVLPSPKPLPSFGDHNVLFFYRSPLSAYYNTHNSRLIDFRYLHLNPPRVSWFYFYCWIKICFYRGHLMRRQKIILLLSVCIIQNICIRYHLNTIKVEDVPAIYCLHYLRGFN